MLVLGSAGFAQSQPATPAQVDLSPANWKVDYDDFLAQQSVERSRAGFATGTNGAVTVAYNALAGRAGLEALQQGGNAMDAAMTAALTQVALTAGAPISYFGILSMVYYDAESGQIHTLDGGWNTVLGEESPLTIPGGISFGTDDALRGTGAPSGRTALVGGFLSAVEAGHRRFGKLPWEELFAPSIYIAEEGFPVSEKFAGYLDFRAADLRRLEETAAIFRKPGSRQFLEAGDVFRQPALAQTLRAVAAQGSRYVYGGPWGKRAVAAIQRDGGKMTLEDLERYEPTWGTPLRVEIDGYEIAVPHHSAGGVHLVEAQLLARASGMLEDGHWTQSGEALRKAHDITQAAFLSFLPAPMLQHAFPEVSFSAPQRTSAQHAQKLWAALAAGKSPFRWAEPKATAAMRQKPKHSDDVVVIDRWGNAAAITHSINCVLWGKTAIIVDGISIGDPASFQQMQIAKLEPGERLPGPTEEGLVLRDGKPVLAFASMGSGLHQRTFQGLLNVLHYGMNVAEAIDTPDFFMPYTDPRGMKLTITVPEGRFEREVLEGTGYAYRELDAQAARFGGEGLWVAISRHPESGRLEAASHNRNNSAAVAY